MAGVAVREAEAEEVADSLVLLTFGSSFDAFVIALGGSGVSVGCVREIRRFGFGLGGSSIDRGLTGSARGSFWSLLSLVFDGSWDVREALGRRNEAGPDRGSRRSRLL